MTVSKFYYSTNKGYSSGSISGDVFVEDEAGTNTKLITIPLGIGGSAGSITALAAPKTGDLVTVVRSTPPSEVTTFYTINETNGEFTKITETTDFVSGLTFLETGELVAAIGKSAEDPESMIVELDSTTFEIKSSFGVAPLNTVDLTTVDGEVWALSEPTPAESSVLLTNLNQPSQSVTIPYETGNTPSGIFTGSDGLIYVTSSEVSDTTVVNPETLDVSETTENAPDPLLPGFVDSFLDTTSREFGNNKPDPDTPVFGTNDHDQLTGTQYNDIIIGLDGYDQISGLDGDDVLIGGEGGDEILGGEGNDQIFGEIGDNKLYGGDGDDVIFGNPTVKQLEENPLPEGVEIGRDYIEGGDGDDGIFGGAGGATIFGGEGNDYIQADAGSNQILGDAGDDQILGGIEGDYIEGGEGDDDIFGRGGEDFIFGGAGDDLIIGGDVKDIIFGGIGSDVILGEDSADILYGQDGDDFISGGDGDDGIIGGEGNDVMSGGRGNDAIISEDGNDVIFADGGDDFVRLGSGIDVLFGGEGADILEIGKDNDQNFWTDFEDGVDKVMFATPVSQLDFANNVVITSTLDGLSTYIAYGETSLILDGVMSDQIDEADFILAEQLV